MKVHFGQIYIEPGVNFPFNYLFQLYLGKEVTALIEASPKFIEKYGNDFDLMFRVSAKKALTENEIRGPTVFRKTKDVEYTIFLPYTVIALLPDVYKSALQFLFNGVRAVFEKLEIDTSKVLEKQEAMIEHICSDPTMIEQPRTPLG